MRDIIEKSLDTITTINNKNIQLLARFCKYSITTNRTNPLIDKVNETAYYLFHSKVWDDLVYCNYFSILDYLHISYSALQYKETNHVLNNKKLESIINIINGPYLLKAEWTSNNLITLYVLSKKLNIPLKNPINIDLNNIENNSIYQTWQWTNENYKTFKEYSLALSTLQNEVTKHSIAKIIYICNKLLASSIVNRDISTISDLLLIYSILNIPQDNLTDCAWQLLSKEKLTIEIALPLIIASDYFK